MKSSHAPAKSNSYMGLAMLALSGSTLSTGRPEMGSLVRPLLLTAPVLGALKKRLPVRELSVASMMAVKRPMTMFSEKKASRSAAASGPLKHVVLDALELLVPAARLEVVEEAHERVDGRKEHRQRDLGQELRKHKQRVSGQGRLRTVRAGRD